MKKITCPQCGNETTYSLQKATFFGGDWMMYVMKQEQIAVMQMVIVTSMFLI